MNIVSGLNDLTYMTSDGFSNLNKSLGNELRSIQSTLGLNNLLTGIQTYQMQQQQEQQLFQERQLPQEI